MVPPELRAGFLEQRRAARTGDNGPGPGGCSHPRSAVVGLRGPLEPLAARSFCKERRLSLAGPDRNRFVRVNRFGPIIAAARRQVKRRARDFAENLLQFLDNFHKNRYNRKRYDKGSLGFGAPLF